MGFRSLLLPALLIFVVGCHSLSKKKNNKNSETFRVTLDTKSAEVIMNFLNGKKIDDDVKAYPGIKALIARNQKTDKSLTFRSFIELGEKCKSNICKDTSGTNFAAVKKNSKVINQFISYLNNNRSEVEKFATATVRENLPAKPINFDYPVYFVVGGTTDAFVEDVDGKQYMVVDLGRMITGDFEKAKDNLFAFVNHEVWHAAYFIFIDKYWDKNLIPYSSLTEKNNDYELIFSMLNEGYGHYMSFLAWYPDKKEALKKLQSKALVNGSEVGYLKLFQEKSQKYLQSKKTDEKKKLLMASQVGDFYKKWGALTGALVVATLDNSVGRKKLTHLISEEPFSLWSRYQTIAAPKYRLNSGFVDFVVKAKSSFK